MTTDPAMITAASSLVGIWTVIPYPTRETTVIFYPNGQGLLFCYWGSCEGTPVLDEFTWEPVREGVLRVTWQVLHLHDEDAEWNAETMGGGIPPPVPVAGREEEVPYTLFAADGARLLTICLGLHEEIDDKLEYAGVPGDFAEERQAWRAHVAHFDPFGPGRQVWLIHDDGTWQPTPYAIAPESQEQALAREAAELPRAWFPWFFLPLIMGVFGQVAYWADVIKHRLPGWLAIALFLLPLLLYLFPSDTAATPALARWARRLRTCAALWYDLLMLGTLAGIACGQRPEGWLLFLIFGVMGLVPTTAVFWLRRRGR